MGWGCKTCYRLPWHRGLPFTSVTSPDSLMITIFVETGRRDTYHAASVVCDRLIHFPPYSCRWPLWGPTDFWICAQLHTVILHTDNWVVAVAGRFPSWAYSATLKIQDVGRCGYQEVTFGKDGIGKNQSTGTKRRLFDTIRDPQLTGACRDNFWPPAISINSPFCVPWETGQIKPPQQCAACWRWRIDDLKDHATATSEWRSSLPLCVRDGYGQRGSSGWSDESGRKYPFLWVPQCNCYNVVRPTMKYGLVWMY